MIVLILLSLLLCGSAQETQLEDTLRLVHSLTSRRSSVVRQRRQRSGRYTTVADTRSFFHLQVVGPDGHPECVHSLVDAARVMRAPADVVKRLAREKPSPPESHFARTRDSSRVVRMVQSNIFSIALVGTAWTDGTYRAPVTGNPASTLGGQRVNAVTIAAERLSQSLDTTVPIRVYAEMGALPCNVQDGIILGGATPIYAVSGISTPDYWYPIAVANKISGFDHVPEPASPNFEEGFDIYMIFSSVVDTGSCPGSWYYGTGNPGSSFFFLETLAHELTHGLGFVSFLNSTGHEFQPNPAEPGLMDIFSSKVYDPLRGLSWVAASPAQRAASFVEDRIEWTGCNVLRDFDDSGQTTAGAPNGRPKLYSKGTYTPGRSVSHFDDDCTPNLLMEPFATLARTDIVLPDLSFAVLRDVGWFHDKNRDGLEDCPANYCALEVGCPAIEFVMLGSGSNTLATSTDGLAWQAQGNSVFSVRGAGATYSETGVWVAVGEGLNSIARTDNPYRFQGLGTAIFSTSGEAVAYGDDLFVAVGIGSNTVASSTNGLDWTPSTAPFSAAYGVAFNGLWVAVGTGSDVIAVSRDFAASFVGVGAQTIFSTGRTVTFSSAHARWIAGGEGAFSLAYSEADDAEVWSGVGGTLFTVVHGVACSPSLAVCVAVGSGGDHTVATSSDGISWVGRGKVFATAGRGVSWSAALGRFAAVGEGTSPYATSADGVSWTVSGGSIKRETFPTPSGVASLSFSTASSFFPQE